MCNRCNVKDKERKAKLKEQDAPKQQPPRLKAVYVRDFVVHMDDNRTTEHAFCEVERNGDNMYVVRSYGLRFDKQDAKYDCTEFLVSTADKAMSVVMLMIFHDQGDYNQLYDFVDNTDESMDPHSSYLLRDGKTYFESDNDQKKEKFIESFKHMINIL